MMEVYMNPALLSSNQLYQLIGLAMLCLVIGWSVTFITLRHDKELIKTLINDGNLVKMLTVIFVVFASTALAVMDKIGTEAISAIFGGIVGYTLGGITKHKPSE